LAVQDDADAFVQNSLFTNNRTNASGHASWAAGGGIHVGNSSLNVSNSRFEYNQAGYVGGAIYARGDWNNPVTTPKTKVIIANSTFYQNKAEPNNVHLSVPTEGGAVHIEDQSVTKIFNSRFILNSSETGGGVNIYRAKVEITDSVFLGNQAVGLGAENGFGGAISAISNDVSSDGGNNRPPADLTIKNTYIQGRYGSIGSVGQVGGGIFVAGDKVRTYGLFGVSRLGTLADNRARLTMENVAIFDSDVTENINTPGSGFGGGIFTDLSVISIQDSIITSSDAIGLNTSGGGGIALIHHSLANINNTTILGNSAGKYGGGVFVQGSYLHLTDCNMVYNEISPGVQELVDTSYGAAIFSSPDTSNNINVTGSVDNCMISENIGLPIYDDDRTGGPINDLRYNNNKIYSTHFSDEVYSSGGVIGVWRLNVNQLNNAVVTRNNGTVTDKVQNPNTALTTVPKVGSLVVVPSQVLPTNAKGDGSSINPAYLVYGWGGSNAQLDGSSLTAKSGVIATSTTGTHHLNVGGQSYYNYLNMGVAPTAELSGDNTYLSWDVTQGSFLTGAMDQGILIPPVPSGSVNNGIMPNRVYRYYTITEEGGVMVSYDNSTPLLSVSTSVTVLSGLNREKNFGSFTLFNIGGSNMNWDASTSSNWVDIIPDSGSTTEFDSIWFELHVKNFSPGTYSANISIDAGEAGSRNVQVSVIVLETIHSTQLPMITR
jgi:predicted outer membrane repeat protein